MCNKSLIARLVVLAFASLIAPAGRSDESAKILLPGNAANPRPPKVNPKPAPVPWPQPAPGPHWLPRPNGAPIRIEDIAEWTPHRGELESYRELLEQQRKALEAERKNNVAMKPDTYLMSLDEYKKGMELYKFKQKEITQGLPNQSLVSPK